MFDAAIARAAAIRAERAALLARAADGLTVGELAAEVAEALAADDPGGLGDVRLLPVLEAMPSSGGKVATRRRLAALGVAEDVTLGAVAPASWARLADA